mmetsp:Transcript_92913/g.298949  ORF Transcript_92913/g.298949 Transcript_92913/m.298949 type:complete len:673 (-) Transcript_92913:43-2061(-)
MKWAKADAYQADDDGDEDLDDIERRIREARRSEDEEAEWERDQLEIAKLLKQERKPTGDFMDELAKATACSDVFVFINKFLPAILTESAKASEADDSAPSRKAASELRTTELGRLILILTTLSRLSRTSEGGLTPAMAESKPMAALLSRLEEILKEVAEDRRHRLFNKFSRDIGVKISKLVAATRGLDKEAPQVLDLVPATAEVLKTGAIDDWVLLLSALEYDVLQEEPVLRDIAPSLARKAKYFQPDVLARLSRVFAKGKTYHQELFEAIALYSKKRLKRFMPRQVVVLVRNLAALRHYDEELMEVVAARVSSEIESYRPFELLLLAWSCGRLRFKDNRILVSIARSVAWNIKEFTGQEVTFIAIAFSKLSYRNENFLAAASEKVTGEVETIDVRYLCQAVYAFSKLEHTDNDFFDAAAQAFLAQGLEKLTTKDLSITIWGYANSRRRQNDLLDLFAERVVGIASTCSNARLLCTAMWGFARLQERNDDLIDAVILRSKVLAPSFATEDFVMLTYGMSRFQEKDIDLLNQLARLMVEMIEDFSELQLKMVARAYAQLGVKHEALFKSIVEELVQKADRLDLDLIVDVCWSLSQVGLSPVKLLELAPKMLREARLTLDEGQVDFALRKQIGDLMWLVGELPAKDVPKGLRAAAKAHSVDVPGSTPARFIVSS